MARHEFVTTIVESIMILIFEMLGTFLLTSLYQSCVPVANWLGFWIGFFILLIFSARISGSHYNPCVTMAFMLRKDTGRFNRWIGLAYMIFQTGGAFLGALFVYYVFGAQSVLTVDTRTDWYQAMTQVILGSFLLVFMYLTQTETSTKLSNDPAITTAVVSSSYVISMIIGLGGSSFGAASNCSISPQNFAVALGIISM
jgi:glycerol uptake facilitator-like aquaporin